MKKLLLPLFLLITGPVFASGLPSTPYVYVQGAAEEKIAPDTLTLDFGINLVDRDQAKAKAGVSEKSAAVFKLLAQLGITDDAITAPDLTVNENYEYSSNRRVFTGYTVARSFSVRLTDFALYPRIVDGLAQLRVDSLNAVIPSTSKAGEIASRLKRSALDNARSQAEALAAGMDARVTGIFAASPIAFGQIHGAIFGSSGSGEIITLSAFSIQSEHAATADRYILAPLTLTERLHVIFLIEPVKE